jgi:hypothetical protein
MPKKSSFKTKSQKSSTKLKLVKIIRSPKKDKKFRAVFSKNGRSKSIDFGARGYENFGGIGKERHLSEERKRRYIERHKKRENWNKPDTAGSLSRWILWTKKSFKASLADYKKRFNL